MDVSARIRNEVERPPDPPTATPFYSEHRWAIRHRVDTGLFWTVGAYWEVWDRHTLHRPERERIERELERVHAEEPAFPGEVVPIHVTYQVGR
jgi:hypothetical protein